MTSPVSRNIWDHVDPSTLTERERAIGKASNLRKYSETYQSARLEFRQHCDAYAITEAEIDRFDEEYRK